MTKEEAYQEYLKGKSLEQVADMLGITRQSIYKSFKSRGYQLRAKTYNDTQLFNGETFSLRASGYYSLTYGKRTLMHRYVWEHFNGQIPEGYDIHHKDEDKTNNDISNLECLPKSEHTRLYSKGRIMKRIICVETGGVYESIYEAERLTGISRHAIIQCLKGRSKTSGGYKWNYAAH